MNTRRVLRLAFTAVSAVCTASVMTVVVFGPLDVVLRVFAVIGTVCFCVAVVMLWRLSGDVFQRADSELPPATARTQRCREGRSEIERKETAAS